MRVVTADSLVTCGHVALWSLGLGLYAGPTSVPPPLHT